MTPDRRHRSAHVTACAVFLAATLLMFGDVLLAGNGRRILSAEGGDLWSIFFYWHEFGFGELARGNLVLWNPYSFGGAPFHGGFQAGLMYPLNWLHLALPTALAINVGVALHCFLAGLWTYLWVSHRRLHPAAGILAGLVFMFCGAHVLQLYVGHLPHLRSLIWAPLIFLAVDGVLESSSVEWVVLGMAAVAMQILAGNVQYVFYNAIIAGIYALISWIDAGRRVRKAGALLAIYAGGASLAAVQLFPGFDAVSESLRAGLSYGIASSFSFPPENLLTLVVPGIYGDMVGARYWGRWALHETSLFVGAVPFFLALLGAVRGDPSVRRYSLAMALIALVLAFGDYTPLFRVLYDYVPGFRSVRAPARFTFLVSLFVAMLAAVGLDHLLAAKRGCRWLAVTVWSSAALLISVGWLLIADCGTGGNGVWKPALGSLHVFEEASQLFARERASESTHACLSSGRYLLASGLTCALLGVLLPATRRSRRFAYAVAIVGVVEVMAYARYSRPTFDPTPLMARSEALRRAVAEAEATRSRVVSETPYFYVALAAGVPDLWGGADLVLDRYARFVAFTQGWQPDAILVRSGMRAASPPLGMLRLRYLVRVDGEQVALVPTRLKELPRAILVSRWRVVPEREPLLAAMVAPAFDAERMVLLESDPGLTPGESNLRGSVSVVDVSTDEMEVWADVPEPAILLITDNYSAGWKATPLAESSGRTYRVVPANYTLRGIPLSAGVHHFRLEYRPTGFVLGQYVTILALLALIVAGGCRWWTSRARTAWSRGRARRPAVPAPAARWRG